MELSTQDEYSLLVKNDDEIELFSDIKDIPVAYVDAEVKEIFLKN